MSKVYRVKEEFVQILEDKRINMIIETREGIAEADIVNAVLWRYLEKITTHDVMEYKEKMGGGKAKKRPRS
ncbi:hypothetical protein [Pseudomonas sp. ENNP23]|uniref:hypothetical protein n=1 Tax=Pseudomonas sp. ENNP23 TaxID=1535636 RepID=UPI0009F67C0A|nr:hypothetical protein [Pseudomonas sp. ENNP23]